VSGHRPSADVLFKSVENIKKGNAVGVILTGMGKDGAEGLLAMKNAGAITLGQDEQTCVVYGMPKVAHLKGGVSRQVPIERMAREMLKSCT
jgi:two-component system chemotaxis response regulator CheB